MMFLPEYNPAVFFCFFLFLSHSIFPYKNVYAVWYAKSTSQINMSTDSIFVVKFKMI